MSDSHDTVDYASRHLWQFKAIQDLFWIALAISMLWFGYYLRGVFIPILVGFGIAYIINPVLTYGERHWKLPRLVTLGLIAGVLLVLSITAVSLLAPVLSEELQMLSSKVPDYADTMAARLDSKVAENWVAELDSLGSELPRNLLQLIQFAASNAGAALGVVSNVVSTTAYATVACCLIPIYVLFFAWHFDPMLNAAKQYVPQAYRKRTLDLFSKMDRAVGAFLRGRLIVTVAMMVMFSIGYFLAGVPYWFLLGTLTGLLAFVPYLPVVGWGLAILVKWVDVKTTGGTASWIEIMLFPSIAYGVVQALEGWLLTPWIQGESMDMSPASILIVVLIGGSLGGLYGLLLAIPLAACARILCQELLLPKLEAWANDTA